MADWHWQKVSSAGFMATAAEAETPQLLGQFTIMYLGLLEHSPRADQAAQFALASTGGAGGGGATATSEKGVSFSL